MKHNYDKYPTIAVTSNSSDCAEGWEEVAERIAAAVQQTGSKVVAVECYPGTGVEEIRSRLAASLKPALVLRSEEALQSEDAIGTMLQPFLTDDPVFGRMKSWKLAEFFDEAKLRALASSIAAEPKLVLVVGTGASLAAPSADLLIYADCARWELQQRQRQHRIGNLGASNASASPAQLYKRAYFVDWRAADERKLGLIDRIDFYLDDNQPGQPRLVSGDLYRQGLEKACTRPFRVVPFFDPGPWGGQWMRRHFDLPDGPPNYAWCFDCVPEENSVLFGFGQRRIESPALSIVHRHPRQLLGDAIHRKLGAEFPIRFDFLDTVGGGNLSLQVHPLKSYISQAFGMTYTQDESYYMLDAEPDAVVYLGLKEGVDRDRMASELRAAQTAGGPPFPAEKYVNAWPARKHDHFLIPAGTIHCSGRNGLVLEISATPYIFTFKLWDWGRLGLNGQPRPIHLDHGLRNIQWDRTTEWVRGNLVGQVRPIAEAEGWREEATGLHSYEFLETRRHWFTRTVEHDTQGNLNVLNLVEGDAAIVSSPDGAFEDFTVHYAETFIVPAAVGRYNITPAAPTETPLGTVKAYVREEVL